MMEDRADALPRLLPPVVVPPSGGVLPMPPPVSPSADDLPAAATDYSDDNPEAFTEAEFSPPEAAVYDEPEGDADVPVDSEDIEESGDDAMPADEDMGMSGAWSVLLATPQGVAIDFFVSKVTGRQSIAGETLESVKAKIKTMLDALTRKIGELNGYTRDYERRRQAMRVEAVRLNHLAVVLDGKGKHSDARQVRDSLSVINSALSGNQNVRNALMDCADAINSINNKFRAFVKLPQIDANMGEPITIVTALAIVAGLAVVAAAVVLAINVVKRQNRLLEESRQRAQLLRDHVIDADAWRKAEGAAAEADAKSDPAATFFKGAGSIVALAALAFGAYLFVESNGMRK